MSIDELSVMDGSKCILQLRGVRPFLSDKYDITKHKNYCYLSDADERNVFDIKDYLSTQIKQIKPDEPILVHEVSVSDEEMPDAAVTDFEESGDVADGNNETDDDADFPIDLEPF